MKTLTKRSWINVLLTMALILLSFSILVSYHQIQRLQLATNWVIHTYQTIRTINLTMIGLNEAESHANNYVITTNKHYLDAIPSMLKQYKDSFENLRKITSDNHLQQQRINQVSPHIYRKHERYRNIHLLTPEQVRNSIVSREELVATDYLTNVLMVLRNEELTLLHERHLILQKMIKRSNLFFLFSSLLSVLLVILSILLLNYHLNKLHRSELMREEAARRILKINKALKESENRVNLTVKSGRTGMWDWDLETDTVIYSDQYKELLGYSEDDFPNTLETFYKVLHPEDTGRITKAIDVAIKNHIPFDQEYRLLNKNGEYQWFRGVGEAIRNEVDKPIRMTGTLTDITERKKAEKLKNEFISIVSHELRTPLTSIRGSLGLILGGSVGEFSEKAKKLLEIANNNCDRLLLLINDILDIEKIEAGKMIFNYKTLDINKIVDQCVHTNKMYADKFGVILECITSSTPLMVSIDPDRTMQVLTNLISNAVKFSPAGKKVCIQVTKFNNHARVSVIDEGAGMSAEFQKKIFQKFTQEDSSDTRGKGGTGLGLNISKAIAEKMKGRLTFESELQKGSSFYLDLPLISAANTSNTEKSLLKKQLLICEDDEDQAKHLNELLQSAGFTTDVAVNAKEAKELLREKKYDALILDLLLPDEDGITFIRELRSSEATQNIPIIVVSAVAEMGKNILNGQAISVVDWLDKPVNFPKLLQTIHKLKQKDKIKPRILHIEDDLDTQKLFKGLCEDVATITTATDLKESRNKLEGQQYDLVVLDLLLPDGNGIELLPLLSQLNIPVIIYSATELDPEYSQYVTQSLTKSKISNQVLLKTIKQFLETNIT